MQYIAHRANPHNQNAAGMFCTGRNMGLPIQAVILSRITKNSS